MNIIQPAVTFFKGLSLIGKGLLILVLVVALWAGIMFFKDGFGYIQDYFSSKKITAFEKETDTALSDAQKSRTLAEEHERQAETTGVEVGKKDQQISTARTSVHNIEAQLQRERARFAAEQAEATKDRDLQVLRSETCARLSRLGFICTQ